MSANFASTISMPTDTCLLQLSLDLPTQSCKLFSHCFYISTGNRCITGDGSFTFEFYGDKIASYLLATGAAAGFAVTSELKRSGEEGIPDDVDKFLNKGYGSAAVVLIGFVCTALLSVFSSYALPRKAN
ncbi:CASP-like protein [Melia azedarach]|uniref:CASP-like protein n=1 Tax=Melia azedarach TaxID=155640 RepID=A0ACC1YBB7_MELAZ|nr:CASP-like protein [Melia azedarach]